jgi:hypothetical protein
MIVYINQKAYDIPTSWHRITWQQYATMPDEKDAWAYCSLSGILPVHDYVLHLLSFLSELPAAVPICEEHQIDITDRSWLDYELASVHLQEENNMVGVALFAGYYTGVDVLALEVPKALGYIQYYSDQLHAIHQQYGHIDFDRFLTERERIAQIDDQGNELLSQFSIESQMKSMGYRPDEYATMLESLSLHIVLREKLFAYEKAYYTHNVEKLNKYK